MEKMAYDLSEKIAIQLHFDDEKKAVIAYGLTAIFQMFFIAILASIIGIIGHFWLESMILFLVVGIIKKSTGGAHSETMFGCILISVFSITFLAMISRYVFYFPINQYINIGISVIIFAFSYIVFYRRVPVDSPNKPIVKPEKIKRLRRQSFFLLTLFTFLSVFLLFLAPDYYRLYSIIFSIRFAIIWQSFTLTQIGIKSIAKFDSKFNSI